MIKLPFNVIDVNNSNSLGTEMKTYEKHINSTVVGKDNKRYTQIERARVLNYIANAINIKLSNEQMIFALANPHSLLCEAGPGSGKTTTLEFKIMAWKIFEGIPGIDIMYLAYNTHATTDFIDRQNQLTKVLTDTSTTDIYGNRLSTHVQALTFHKFAISWVKEYPKEAGMSHFEFLNKVLLDEYDLSDYYKKAIIAAKKLFLKQNKEIVYTPDDYKLGRLCFIDSYRKENMMSVDDVANSDMFNELKMSKEFYALVVDRVDLLKTIGNVWTFADFLEKFNKILDNKEIAKRVGNAYPYLLVDEYQDMTNLMRSVLRKLNPYIKYMVAVGDGDQSIYRFRGTDHRNVLKFEDEFEDTLITKLTLNRRCPAQIVELSNRILDNIGERLPKHIQAVNNGGSQEHILYNNKEDMLDDIIKKLKEMDRSQRNDTVITFRNKRISLYIALRLIEENIGIRLGSALPPFKDHLNLAMYNANKLLMFPSDLFAMEKSLYTMTKLRKAEVVQIVAAVRKTLGTKEANKVPVWKLSEIKSFYGEHPGLRDDISKIKELHERAMLSHESNEGIASELFLLIKQNYYSFIKEQLNYPDELEERILSYYVVDKSLIEVQKEMAEQFAHAEELTAGNAGVYLTTMHGLKGLEFENVFIAELEEGVIPSMNMFKEPSKEDLDADWRLFYVALTRVKKNLYTYFSKVKPSRFIDIVDESNITKIQSIRQKAVRGSNLNLHKEKIEQDLIISIERNQTATNEFVDSYAKLFEDLS